MTTEVEGDPWATIHGFLEERADYLRVEVSRRRRGEWDVVLRLDGTYFDVPIETSEPTGRAAAEQSADVIREQLAQLLTTEIPGIEREMVRWYR